MIRTPAAMQITSLDYSSYVGKIGVGRISRPRQAGQDVVWMNGPDDKPTKARINQVLTFKGLERVLVDEARPATSC
jgi:GTP-binding protein